MNKVELFFESNPQAIDILPVYSLDQLLRWIGEKEPYPYDWLITFPSFPIAQKVYSRWFAENIYWDDSLKNKQKEEIIRKYRELFKQRIRLLLDFEGPKTPDTRIQDIQVLRDDFFLYPVELEKELLGRHKKKQIDSFEDIERALTKNTPLRNFRKEAREKSLGSIAFFDREKHLSPHFSGFVENVEIYSEPISVYSTLILQAQWVYIQNGKIIWSIHSTDSLWSLTPMILNASLVKWHSGDFILEEMYSTRGREGTQPILNSQRRIVKYRFDDPRIQQVKIIQQLTMDTKEEFIIEILKDPKNLVIHRITRTSDRNLYRILKTNPAYLSEIDTVIEFLDMLDKKDTPK